MSLEHLEARVAQLEGDVRELSGLLAASVAALVRADAAFQEAMAHDAKFVTGMQTAPTKVALTDAMTKLLFQMDESNLGVGDGSPFQAVRERWQQELRSAKRW